MRDLEAFLDSANQRVEGEARVLLYKGHVRIVGVRSPYAMLDADVATYGEAAAGWSGEEAAGFARIYGLGSMLAKRAGERGDAARGSTEERS
jgi:argininosuccinate synthase